MPDDSSAMLAEVPGTVRNLVIGHWPDTEVGPMRRCGDAHLELCKALNAGADQYAASAARAETAVEGEIRTGLAQRHRAVEQAMRDQAALHQSLGTQFHDTADATRSTQHLLIVAGIALAAQLAYDSVLFFQGGGFKAISDRLAAEAAMRAATEKLAVGIAQNVAAGQVKRMALHGAIRAAKVGALFGAVTSGAAQIWDLAEGNAKSFNTIAFAEMVAGGAVGGAVGAEVGRRFAPKILDGLAGRAVSAPGRLAAHVGGTTLIGGAGGVSGGVFGALPALAVEAARGNVRSLDDAYKMVRDSAITGFGSGFVGASFSSLRMHQAGADGRRNGFPLSESLRRRQEYSAHIDELLRSGVQPRVTGIPRDTVVAKSAKLVERLTFPDGTEVIHKVVSMPQHAHAEFLGSLVGDAVGVNVPRVHVDGSHVYMEVVPGRTAFDAFPGDWKPADQFHGTPGGERMGVLDLLLRIPDRNSENWMVDHDNELWGAIDNSRAFETADEAKNPISAFAKQFQDYGPDSEIVWKEHTFPRAEIHQIRENLEGMRPAFYATGRREWFDAMMSRLDTFESHAVDGGGAPRVTAPPHEPPSSRGGAAVRHTEGESVAPNAERVSAPRSDRPAPRGDDLVGPGLRTPWSREGGPAPSPDEHVPVGVPEQSLVEPSPQRRPGPDEPTYEGSPTQRLPRVEPENAPGNRDPAEASARPIQGMTAHYVHPEGYVDVQFTGPNGERVAHRLMPGEEYTLGRGKGALLEDVALTDAVSRRHAVIKVDDEGHVFIRDDSSINGTYVDGKQVHGDNWVRVYDGEKLMLSSHFTVDIGFVRQMVEVRPFGDQGPTLQLYRGKSQEIGRGMLHPEAFGRSTVSTGHALLGVDENGRVWIKDLESRNGTKVFGVPLGKDEIRYLDPGDRVNYGAYRHDMEFTPPDVKVEAVPLRVEIAMGATGAVTRLEPGRPVLIGTDERSPFADHLRGKSQVASRHAMLGLDVDGRLWIRDEPGSPGVWVNGDQVTPGQKVTVMDGDTIGIGPDVPGIAHVRAAHTGVELAELQFAPEHNRLPILLEPGGEHAVNIDELLGNTGLFDFSNGEIRRVGGREVIFGRDVDGRVWVLDEHGQGEVRINDKSLGKTKTYLGDEDVVSLGGMEARLRLGEEAPIQLRLSDDPDSPVLSLRRNDEVKIGRAHELADELGVKVSRHHATIYRDEYGRVWLRDEGSLNKTFVRNVQVDPAHPVELRSGDPIRMGDWLGGVQFSDGFQKSQVNLLAVQMNSSHGYQSLDLVRGGEPTTLGRGSSHLPESVRDSVTLSRRHASVGVHPSGRVWIRDEGSLNHTYVNDKPIEPHAKTILKPGDKVTLGGEYEFTVAYPPPEGGPFVNSLDREPATVQAVKDLSLVPRKVFNRVSDFLNASGEGGIVIGRRAVAEHPGLETLVQRHPEGPNDKVRWDKVAGLYVPSQRRLYIDANHAQQIHPGSVVGHEFGHAVADAYSVGGVKLDKQPEWLALHQEVVDAVGHRESWDSYCDPPEEGFADAFSAWLHGRKQLQKYAAGHAGLAAKLKDYFDRTLLT
ncbi:MAG: FHA domain-containing protein [Mycobacteriaceae bacterium]|nr:FHA domain-containing protein [Mycobacteriaceae bacterium]